MSEERPKQEQDFLIEINSWLPKGLDWKQGAKRYLGRKVEAEGEHARRYHLIKPFVGGPDFAPFFSDMRKFLNIVEKLKLPMKSALLDVACGPGWVSHYLGKLGHTVLGIDISEELLDVARERLAADPFPVYPEAPFDVSFLVHDIETGPLEVRDKFDAAIFEACVHHFYDPVSALRNVAHSLKPDGLIAIIEGSAPAMDSEYHMSDLQIMREYHTLERPLTRAQMIELLRLTGFEHYEFYYPIDGYFAQTVQTADTVRERILNGTEWNVVIASQSSDRMEALSDTFKETSQRDSPVQFLDGFYDEENATDGASFRWSKSNSSLVVHGVNEIELIISSHLPRICKREQTVFVYVDDALHRTITLSPDRNSASVAVTGLRTGARIDLFSDSVFSPRWFGDHDRRLLSFILQLRLPT